MCAFHLPDVVCVTMKIKHMLLLDRSACFFMTSPRSGHLLCPRVTIYLVPLPNHTPDHYFKFCTNMITPCCHVGAPKSIKRQFLPKL
jgi:hypothetical protein